MVAAHQFGLIQIASDQALPGLLTAHSLGRDGLLGYWAVLATTAFHDSALRRVGGVQRLAGAGCTAEVVAVDATAPAVWSAAQEAFSRTPTVDWVLDATGGTKPMSMALLLLARHPRVAAVIYRDLHRGTWLSFGLGPQGEPVEGNLQPGTALHNALVANPAQLNDLPLPWLVSQQLGQQTVNALAPASLEAYGAISPLAWFDHVARRGGHWGSYLPFCEAARSVGDNPMDGVAWERWVALLLMHLGARQVLGGLVGYRRGSPVFECDVLAGHGNRLVLVDCKLSDRAGKSEQIRALAQTARSLGGLGATALALRPAWAPHAGLVDLAAALGVGLVHRAAMADLITRLAEPLGLLGALNGEVAEVGRRLAQAKPDRLQGWFTHRAVAPPP